jgi:hypothetical protein
VNSALHSTAGAEDRADGSSSTSRNSTSQSTCSSPIWTSQSQRPVQRGVPNPSPSGRGRLVTQHASALPGRPKPFALPAGPAGVRTRCILSSAVPSETNPLTQVSTAEAQGAGPDEHDSFATRIVPTQHSSGPPPRSSHRSRNSSIQPSTTFAFCFALYSQVARSKVPQADAC